ncbi:MAG: hypothetical protein JSC188_000068 [Candidatus Tokpelaia sp. JSC188]|nr:MAG: hypothetical protein JSC188_000068 [Candidatus Tokpelaia sp. JSC188]
MRAKSRRYIKLLKIQNLIRMRDHIEIEMSRRDLITIENENNYLRALMEKGSKVDFIDSVLLCRRLERNRHNESILQAKIVHGIKALLRILGRCDILKNKQREAQYQEECKEFATMLEEYIAARCQNFPHAKSSFIPVSLKFDQL